MPSNSMSNALALLATAAEPEYRVRDAPRHPDAVAFLAACQACGRDLIVGRDLPSRHLARFLANLMLIEPMGDAVDCRIRLAGSIYRQRFGREITGDNLSNLFPPRIFVEHCERLAEVRRTGTPLFLIAQTALDDGLVLRYELAVLRVYAADERTVWNAVGLFLFEP